MDRRGFARGAGLLLAGITGSGRAQENQGQSPWADLERRVGGRVGVAVLDPAVGRLEGHRLDERFPMCSTFKWLAAAKVLQRVDAGLESLDRRVPVRQGDLLDHSPAAAPRVGASMSVGELCDASVTLSDNAAANLLLASFGGPRGLTAFARSAGDRVTRLDRTEPALNEGRPGDPRDTTSPAAMARTLQRVLLGDALSPPSREQLTAWMLATRTSGERLRKDLPAGWRLADKTGTGRQGTANDVGVFWRPDGRPVVVAVYLTGGQAAPAALNNAIADVARAVVRRG